MTAAPATRELLLAIDQGTTGSTVLLVDAGLSVVGRGYQEIPQRYPAPGLVEHDPAAIYSSVLDALAQARAAAPDRPIAAVGITNQRETTIVWDRRTGEPIAPAIVWQDRRTAPACEALRAAGHERAVQEATGLVIDPYFSATKVGWLLDAVPGARRRAEAGELAFGTVDTWLVHRLTGGSVQATDPSNASRTLLFDLRRLAWSEQMAALFRVPLALLPEVRPSAGRFGETRGVPGIPDGTPIAGVAGDQQAALFGQGCEAEGEAKCTFGTGSFLLMNVGERPILSRHRLLTSVAWTLGGRTSYALEGGAFVCGALVQWLRDGLGVIERAADVEALARSVPDSGGVVIVPAFAGLGAPHWRADARGLIDGLTRGTTRAHLARAALEAMALQNVDLIRAMESDLAATGAAPARLTSLRVDGGAAANDLLMQIQADLLGVEIRRPAFLELTALGAARLAARGVGLPIADLASSASGVTRFEPRLAAEHREEILARWRTVVAKT